jgi:tetratricopeptide (TPR) repeat protein
MMMPTNSHKALEHNKKGNRLLKKGELQEAHSHFIKALELDSGFEEAWVNLAVLFVAARELGKALEVFDEALDLFPESSHVWGSWGSFLGAFSGSDEQIEEAFQKALQLDPNNSKAWGGLALHLQDRSVKEAENAFRRALELNPDDEKMRYFFAQMLNTQQRGHDAEENLRIVLEQAPEYADAWMLLGQVLHNIGKTREGIEACLKAIELDHEKFEYWNDLARLQYAAGYLRQTRITLRHMLSMKPHYVEGWKVLIALLGEMGLGKELDEAQEMMDGIIAANPGFHVNKEGYLEPKR